MAKALAVIVLWCAACGSSPGAPMGAYTLELTPAPPYPAQTLTIVAYDIIEVDTYTATTAFVDTTTSPAHVTFDIHHTFPGEGGTLDESWALTMDSDGGTGTATIMRQQSQVVATKQ
jgi:hypothetical protein